MAEKTGRIPGVFPLYHGFFQRFQSKRRTWRDGFCRPAMCFPAPAARKRGGGGAVDFYRWTRCTAKPPNSCSR